jgi:hypothetical protein
LLSAECRLSLQTIILGIPTLARRTIEKLLSIDATLGVSHTIAPFFNSYCA